MDPEAESAESMTSYQYAGNNPIMNNDPMGNLLRYTPPPDIVNQPPPTFGHMSDDFDGGDPSYDEYSLGGGLDSGTGESMDGWFAGQVGVGGLYAPGGGPGAGEDYAPATTSDFGGTAFDHSINTQISQAWGINDFMSNSSHTISGQTYFVDYDPITSAVVGGGVYDYSIHTSGSTANANQGGDQPLSHAQELAKYGQVIGGGSDSYGSAVGKRGFLIEHGYVITDKGWRQDYETTYHVASTVMISVGAGSFELLIRVGIVQHFLISLDP